MTRGRLKRAAGRLVPRRLLGGARRVGHVPVGLVRRLRPRTELGWDIATVVVTLVLLAIAWPTLFGTHQVADSLAPMVAVAGVAPLLMLRVQPFAGWAMSAAVAVMVALSVEPLPEYGFTWHPVHFIVLLVLLFAVALTAPARDVVVAWAATVTVFMLFLPDDLKGGWAFGATMLTVVGLLLRWLVLSRRELARQEQVSEQERARRAVLEERSRIARDLHDVVAHSMSMVVVQAQSAPQRLGGVSPEVQREFSSISEQARQALNEVRGMLGVLRSDGQLAENVPQPGLGDVETILREAREAGVDLDWSVAGDPEGCSQASAMVVVRVLQESLANASRHAPGSQVRVDVEYAEQVVRISVANTAGRPVDRTGAKHGGAGLTGMATRTKALGGRLTARPTEDGGFLVLAEVPRAATGAVGAVS